MLDSQPFEDRWHRGPVSGLRRGIDRFSILSRAAFLRNSAVRYSAATESASTRSQHPPRSRLFETGRNTKLPPPPRANRALPLTVLCQGKAVCGSDRKSVV